MSYHSGARRRPQVCIFIHFRVAFVYKVQLHYAAIWFVHRFWMELCLLGWPRFNWFKPNLLARFFQNTVRSDWKDSLDSFLFYRAHAAGAYFYFYSFSRVWFWEHGRKWTPQVEIRINTHFRMKCLRNIRIVEFEWIIGLCKISQPTWSGNTLAFLILSDSATGRRGYLMWYSIRN